MAPTPSPLAYAGLTCPHCGYNLTGAAGPRCPECGQGFDPARLAPSYGWTRWHWRKFAGAGLALYLLAAAAGVGLIRAHGRSMGGSDWLFAVTAGPPLMMAFAWRWALVPLLVVLGLFAAGLTHRRRWGLALLGLLLLAGLWIWMVHLLLHLD